MNLIGYKQLIKTNSVVRKLEIESRLRLFQQLHQSEDNDWHRANGRMYCELCGMQYSLHPVEENYNIDHRLCNGTIVHL